MTDQSLELLATIAKLEQENQRLREKLKVAEDALEAITRWLDRSIGESGEMESLAVAYGKVKKALAAMKDGE